MRGIFLGLIFAFLMLQSFSAPFIAALAYVWIDILKPQQLASYFFNKIPLSLIAAGATVLLYILFDRRERPKLNLHFLLLIFFAIWITINCYLSPLGNLVWSKWDWVIKVVAFSVLIPYLFRSRIQIEAFLLIFIFSISTIVVSAGIKTALGGGGYGHLAFIGGQGNTGLTEGSTVAAACVMIVPIIDYIRRYSLIMVENKYTKYLFIGIIFASVLTVIGTTARTGLIAFGVLFMRLVMNTKKKFLWLFLILVGTIIISSLDLESTRWGSRMSTIESYQQDSSALGRIAVWKWTLGYVAEHPFGGGFDAFRLNKIRNVYDDGIEYWPDYVNWGKAFHSIYFETLGEQGIPGFLMYFGMVFLSWRKMTEIHKKYKEDKDMAWMSYLARRLQDSIAVLLVAGAFIGIAYQPIVLYLLAATISVNQYVIRYEKYKNNEY